MRIEPEGVWKERYRKAYLRTKHKEGRWMVDLVNTEQDRTTVSYAKYIYSIHLGRILSREEHVDHINGDKTDDRLENLQVLSVEEHRAKTSEEQRVERLALTCSHCQKVFFRRPNQVRVSEKLGRKPYCSRTCNGKANGRGKGGKVTADQVRAIRQSQEVGARLAEQYGISESMVSRIRLRKARQDVPD